MFKKGNEIICIDNENGDYKSFITIGKIYKVTRNETQANHIYIINDLNKEERIKNRNRFSRRIPKKL